MNTFSIVAYDPDENAWGVAVASKFLAAAAIVGWARAGAGAIATQAYARVSYGIDGLVHLAAGKSAQETLGTLLADDDQREERQVALVDANGRVAAYTGPGCADWAGHKIGQHYACQGNILVGEKTINAMSEAFLNTTGELADRLVAALEAGERAGGDRRGKQSAGVLVVRPNGGYGGDNDRYLDLRVDDDPNPIKKLKKMVLTHHLFFSEPYEDDLIAITPEIATELQQMLLEEQYFGGEANGEWDEMSKQAFWSFVGNENLEARWQLDGKPNHIDRVTLEYLRDRFA